MHHQIIWTVRNGPKKNSCDCDGVAIIRRLTRESSEMRIRICGPYSTFELDSKAGGYSTVRSTGVVEEMHAFRVQQ